jgi:hypothetical protein
MKRMNGQVRAGLGMIACVAMTAALGLSACGSKKNADVDKIAEQLGMKPPSGAITTNGIEAKALTTTKNDWTKIETTGEAPAPAPKEKVDPTTITTDGIVAPMHGMTSAQPTGFRVAYAPTQRFAHFRDAFKQDQVFENVAAMLNQILRMPRLVDIQMVECGTVNAFYDPNNNRIIMCYELMDYYTKMFKPVSKTNDELGNAIVGATFFAFFHELGHGLIHQLDIPAVGREEDAVDQMATLILMQNGDSGVAAAMSGAKWFALQADANKKEGAQMPFWDEHSMEEQRFYNIACLVFGSNPEKYGPMVDNNYLPKPRAMRCPDEFAKISNAWEKLLQPHIKDDAAAPVAVPTLPTQPEETPPAQPTGGPMAPQPLPGDEPTQQPTPAPTPAADQGISCETVVNHALEVIYTEAMAGAAKAGNAEEVKSQLEANLPIIYQQGVQECKDENWPQDARACVMRASTIAAAQGCGID